MAKEKKPYRWVLRIIAALGIGLGASAIWWEYSDQVIDQFGGVIGIERSSDGL